MGAINALGRLVPILRYIEPSLSNPSTVPVITASRAAARVPLLRAKPSNTTKLHVNIFIIDRIMYAAEILSNDFAAACPAPLPQITGSVFGRERCE
jgi:hypothetical protein